MLARDGCANVREHSLKLAQHALIGEANDAITEPLELPLAARVGAARLRMVTAVDFNDEPTGGSEEINDALSDDDLPAEGDAELRPSEGVPKLGFSESGLSAESASAMSEELRAR